MELESNTLSSYGSSGPLTYLLVIPQEVENRASQGWSLIRLLRGKAILPSLGPQSLVPSVTLADTKNPLPGMPEAGLMKEEERLQLLHLEAAELDRVAVASEADEPLGVVEALGRMRDLGTVKGGDVNVQNLGAVEGHFDLLALDFDLLEVPLAYRAQVAMLGTHTVVE